MVIVAPQLQVTSLMISFLLFANFIKMNYFSKFPSFEVKTKYELLFLFINS